MIQNFNNVMDLLKAFPDEETCIKHLTALRRPNGVCCPHCGSLKVYTLHDHTYKCGEKECRKKFSVRHGTIFQDSKLPLDKWFLAIYFVTSHKKGIASTQLAKNLGITQKAAWHVIHRIQKASETKEFKAPLANTVQLDETYVGGLTKNKHMHKRTKGAQGGGSAKDKKVVFAMLEKGGELRMHKIDGANERSIRPLVEANVAPDARVHTDEAPHYNWMRRNFAHDLVTHRKGQYVKGDATTNDVEGVFSHFKRMVIGIHHHISDEHIDKYLDMFSWRWNSRDMKEGERVNELLKAVNGRTLTYRTLIRKDS